MQKGIFWSSVVRMLMQSGLAQKQISAATGISQPMVSRLSDGKREEPSYSQGEAIKALFAQTFPGQPLPELPTPITHPAPDLALETQGV